MEQADSAAVKLKDAGEGAIVVAFGAEIAPETNRKVQSFTAALRRENIAGIFDVVPAYCSVTVYFDPLAVSRETLRPLILAAAACPELQSDKTQRLLKVPVCYGGVLGPDLEYVARSTGLSPEQVIELHTKQPYLVYMLGFTPGFAFLGGLPEPLVLPRQSEPRPRVPIGSVGIAGRQTGFYAVESQGEWWLIGRTPLRGFDAAQQPMFLLKPGDYVQFVAIDQEEYFALRRQIKDGKYAPQFREVRGARA